MATTNEFKKTEIGKIPVEWELEEMGNLFEIKQGKALSKKHREGKRPRPFLRTSNVFWGCTNFSDLDEMDFTEEEEKKYQLKKDDLLICEGGDIGRTAILEEDLPGVFYQNHVFRVRANGNNIYPRYAMFWMDAAQNIFDHYSGTANKTTIANLSKSRLSKYKIPVPPLPEQKKIARKLTVIRDTIEQTQTVIEATEELKKSMMKHLFTYGPVPADQTDHVELKRTDIGMMSASWKVLELEKIAKLKRGKDLTRKNMVEGKFPVVGSSGIIGTHNKKHAIGPGVTVGRSGSVGNLSYIDEDYWPHNTTLYVENFCNNNPKYIFYLLHKIDFKKYATGVSVPTLNRNFVHGLKLALPNLKLQDVIVSKLSRIDQKILLEKNKLTSLNQFFETLLENLMSAKIRVN